MKKVLISGLIAGFFATGAIAGDTAKQVEELSRKYGCSGCHELGRKYKIKIKMAYMPAQHGVNKEKAEKIVDLILKLETK